MPQSTKDSRGGKNAPSTKSKTPGRSSAADEAKSARSAKSPTGPMNKGEKKTTP